MSKQETVEVTIKLPKTVVDFIKDMEGDVAEYVAYTIVDLMTSYVEGVNAEQLMAKYNLKPAFKEYGVLASYYKNL
jgi:hypothetical protein